MSKILALEGIDGIGKTTIATELRKQGYADGVIPFPSKGGFGKSIRETFGEPDHNPYISLTYGALDRHEYMATIRDKLDQGKTLILDRWRMSGAVYEMANILYEFRDQQPEAEAYAVDFMNWANNVEDLFENTFFETIYIAANGNLDRFSKNESCYDRNREFQDCVHRAYEMYSHICEDEYPILRIPALMTRNGNIRREVHSIVNEIIELI